MDDFLSRIQHPALADVRIDWNGMQVEDVFPQRIPDLFVGRPAVLTGRFRGEPAQEIRVLGRAGTEPFTLSVHRAGHAGADAASALPSVWARMKIAGLAETSWLQQRAAPREQIQKLALDFHLMSAFTAFTAVDSATRTEGGPAVPAKVAVPVPAGVNSKTTIGE